MKKDLDGNFYNDILTSLIEVVLVSSRKIISYPSFSSEKGNFYLEAFLQFLVSSFDIDDVVFGELP